MAVILSVCTGGRGVSSLFNKGLLILNSFVQRIDIPINKRTMFKDCLSIDILHDLLAAFISSSFPKTDLSREFHARHNTCEIKIT